MILTREQYNNIMSVIDYRTPEEIIEEFKITKQIAYSIYTQNIIKYVKRNHHRIKNLSPQLYRSWRRGKTILNISNEKKFPPALIANFILSEHGMKKREIQQILLDPSSCSTRRLGQELKDAMEKDRVYSPSLNDKRALEGRRGEVRLEDFLDDLGIEYYAESDLRFNDHFPKTPDILFKKEDVNIKGHIVNWIESKSNFGSPTEFRNNYRKQLSSYTELFGPGIVVYWYGYVEGINVDTSITVVEREFFYGEDYDPKSDPPIDVTLPSKKPVKEKKVPAGKDKRKVPKAKGKKKAPKRKVKKRAPPKKREQEDAKGK